MTPLQAVERELTTHAAALRALAHDLVGDRHLADDLVQETALRALRTPPREPAGLLGWLATILRRLASKHRRGELRREERERRAAVPEAVPPAEHTLGRHETLRRVTDAVLALPEPYQTAVVLRYFEELTPTAIAARTVTPLATVKSRLQRGLILLRGELDARDRRGAWRGALLAITGLAPARPVLLTTGVLLMAPTAKLACATCAAALLGAVVLFTRDTISPAPPAAAFLDEVAEPVAAAAGAATSPVAAAERHEVAPPPSLPPGIDLAHPFAFELRCRVLDRDGLAVEGAQLFLAPEGCALNTWPEPTGADGGVVLRWRGLRPEMAIAVGVRAADINQMLQRVTVRSGLPQDLPLLGEQKPQGTFKLSAKAGAGGVLALSFEPVVERPCKTEGEQPDCRGCHEGPQLRSVFDGRLAVRTGLHPAATFADLLLPRRAGPPPAGHFPNVLLETLRAVKSGPVGAPVADPVVAHTGRITGRVHGPDGMPAVNETVICGTDVTRPANRTRTRKDGAFVFEGVPAGSVEVRCGGGDRGLAVRTVEVVAGREARADLVLHPGHVIHGRAVGADGAPLARWRVEYVALREQWTDTCTVREDGTFVLPNLPAGPGRLFLWPRRGGHLPAAVESGVLPDGGEVLFDLRTRGDAKGALRLLPIVPGNAGKVAVEARVWQMETGRGSGMAAANDGSFVLAGLAAGFYRVELGAEATGWRDLGQSWVDGRSLRDLGRVDLPQPGTVRLRRGVPLRGGPEFYLRLPDGDVRAEDAAAASGEELVLPAGDWLCLWREAGGDLGARTFTVRAGGTEVVEIGAPATEMPPGK